MISEKAAFLQCLPPSARIKIDLMFSGIRYSEALGCAADHASRTTTPTASTPARRTRLAKGLREFPT